MISLIGRVAHFRACTWLVFPAEVAKQTHEVESMLVQRWSNVYDAGPTLNQHWLSVLCLLGGLSTWLSRERWQPLDRGITVLQWCHCQHLIRKQHRPTPPHYGRAQQHLSKFFFDYFVFRVFRMTMCYYSSTGGHPAWQSCGHPGLS